MKQDPHTQSVEMQNPSAPEMEQPASTQSFQTQPMPVEVQSVPIGQPIPALHQPQIVQKGYQPAMITLPATDIHHEAKMLIHWESGLCDCFAQCAPSLLMAWCCPCFTIARIRAIEGIKEPNFCCVEDKFWPNCLMYSIPGFLYTFGSIVSIKFDET
mmetsp:Transcript_1473/g.2090  ORF Transcript_1473/g.2090 Transcript_1473/m.2090 type:complete len:157 (-) Transcript_1473:2134-2604(-)